MAISEARLNEFMGRLVQDFGAVMHDATVVVGDQLGLNKALAEGPATAEELAKRTQTDPRYLREWLSGQDSLKPNGAWMIVEPFANDRLEDNPNPVGRVFFSASTFICKPASRAQEVVLCLGAQAGEARMRTSSRKAVSGISGALPRRRSTWFMKHVHKVERSHHVTPVH